MEWRRIMYNAEKEIFNQFESLNKTMGYLSENRERISRFFDGSKKVIFIGSGSSYSIAKSASMILELRTDIKTVALASGDLLINFDKYTELLDSSTIVAISRSGSTSELVHSLKRAKQELNCSVLSLCAKEKSDIASNSDLSLEIPWAFDYSVCQTQTVSNLYAGCIMIDAVIGKDALLESEAINVAKYASEFQEKNLEKLKAIGKSDFNYGIILGENEIAGIAEEGALAFKEICQLNSNQYPVLDVRHGPIVKIDSNSLVILTTDEYDEHITKLVGEIRAKGAYCLTLCKYAGEVNSDTHIEIPDFVNICVSAVYMLFAIQVITLTKAISLGINPDEPDGLDAWINLEM